MKYFLKSVLPESLLAALFMFSIAASMMSAYTTSQLIVKVTLALVTAITLFIIRRPSLPELRSDKGLRSIALIFTGIFFYFSVTLTYTSNFSFGLLKTLNFLVVSVLMILLYIYLKGFSPVSLKIALYTIAGISIIFIFTAVIISPFVYTSKYTFSFDRWSHILSGRMIAGVTVLFIILLASGKKIISTNINFVISVIMIFGLSYIGSRLSTITTGLIICLILVYIFAQNKKATPMLFKVALLLILLITFLALLPKTNESAVERYNFLLEINKDKVEDMIDGAMKSRISGYRTAHVIAAQHPILGKGIGGFKDDPNYYLTSYLQYPHNIFLEVVSEFGIPALILFCIILVFLLLKSYRKSPLLFIFIIFALILAQFSKDIPTQTFLWISVMIGFGNLFETSERVT